MFKRTLLMFCVAIALAVAACTSSETNSNNHNATAANSATSNTATSTTTPASTTATTGKIGVPECDAFIEKYAACVSARVPEAARSQYKNTLEQWTKSWRELAANPQTKASLTAACKTSMEQARQSMKSYGCQF
jgi:hypothetical protein